MDKNKRLTVWLPVIIAASIALGIFVKPLFIYQSREKNGPTPAVTKINAILDIIDEQYVDTVIMSSW